jgi:hypothetical protein
MGARACTGYASYICLRFLEETNGHEHIDVAVLSGDPD